MTSDSELLALSSLLASPVEDQRRFFAAQYPIELFPKRRKEYLWLITYWREYARCPSRSLFESANESLPETSESLAACMQPVHDRFQYQGLRQAQLELKRSLEKGSDISSAMAVFRNKLALLTVTPATARSIDFGSSYTALTDYLSVVAMREVPGTGLLNFPWPSLNSMIGFMRLGDTMIVASRTSIGKTWLILWLTHHYAQQNARALALSAEMTSSSLVGRMEALHFKLPYALFRRGELPGPILARWKAQRRLESTKVGSLLPLRLVGADAMPSFKLSAVESLIVDYRPRVVVLDGAYLLKSSSDSPRASDTEKLAHLSHEVNLMAKRHQTAIVLVVQLNREAEKTSGMTIGSLTTIYNCDAFAQDADYVLLLSGKRGTAERTVSLAKGRESAVGDFRIHFKLDPFPDFSETRMSTLRESPSEVSFKGLT